MNFMTKMSLVALSAFAFNTQAALVHSDWKVAGDKQAALDTATGLEWLNLSHTKGMSIESILPDLLEGKAFEGWRLPTQAEVIKLITGQFGESVLSVSQSTSNSSLTAKGFDIEQVRAFSMMLGGGNWGTGGYLYSGGYFKRDDGQQGRGGFIVYNGITAGVNNGWYFNPTTTKTATIVGSSTYAVYLVSDGGLTMSSLNDPLRNINNPNAPVNTNPPPVEPPPTDVSAPWGLSMMLMGLLFLRKLRRS